MSKFILIKYFLGTYNRPWMYFSRLQPLLYRTTN